MKEEINSNRKNNLSKKGKANGQGYVTMDELHSVLKVL